MLGYHSRKLGRRENAKSWVRFPLSTLRCAVDSGRVPWRVYRRLFHRQSEALIAVHGLICWKGEGSIPSRGLLLYRRQERERVKFPPASNRSKPKPAEKKSFGFLFLGLTKSAGRAQIFRKLLIYKRLRQNKVRNSFMVLFYFSWGN